MVRNMSNVTHLAPKVVETKYGAHMRRPDALKREGLVLGYILNAGLQLHKATFVVLACAMLLWPHLRQRRIECVHPANAAILVTSVALPAAGRCRREGRAAAPVCEGHRNLQALAAAPR